MDQETHNKIEELLTRGVENVYPSKDFLEARLKEEKTLTLYLGVDPTGPSLHLGHAIVLMKLRQFQDLGHKIILLIGDFTAMIGDPTDKGAARTRLTQEETRKNAERYKDQASKIIRFDGENPAELKYNSEWLGKMTFADVVDLSSHFTVQQMMQRDMFQRRLEEEKPIYVHEFMYPLMQAHDCVVMDVDGEVGGNDQTFNMLAGRTLMKDVSGKEKFVIGMKLLTDPTGKKMGKSEGNMITLNDSSDEMFGKIMSWPDGMIVPGFELLTNLSVEEVEKDLEAGKNPRDVKERLAREVVAFYFDEQEAEGAAERFVQLFKKKETPEDVPEHVCSAEHISVVDALVETGLASSKSEARRLIDGGGVRVNEEVVTEYEMEIDLSEEALLQKGKRHFVRLKQA